MSDISEVERNVFFDAIKTGDLARVQEYVERTPVIVSERNNGRDWGYTGLIVAIHNNRTEIATYLIEHGVDIDATFRSEDVKAIHIAAEMGNLSIIESLVKAGADIHEQDNRDGDVVYYAVSGNKPDLVRCLVNQYGMDPEGGIAGVKSIKVAAGRGYHRMIEALLNLGVCVKDSSALECAIRMPYCTGGCGEDPAEDYLKTIETLLNHGAPVDGISDQETPLIAYVKDLYHSNYTKTPGMNGTQEDPLVIPKMLLAHGADTTRVDDKGKTVLDYAKEYKMKGLVALLKRAEQKRSKGKSTEISPSP